eukprot:m.72865 g.72865  ORF g.72865 m.72865 type:complete len:267 (+) comp12348_c0_seq1:117-917(+)
MSIILTSNPPHPTSPFSANVTACRAMEQESLLELVYQAVVSCKGLDQAADKLETPSETVTTIAARVICDHPQRAGAFEFLSGPSQPFPFVAKVNRKFLLACAEGHMSLLQLIGFTTDEIKEWSADGTQFRLALFLLTDCPEAVSPTWDGLIHFVEGHSPECATKLKKHAATFKEMGFDELVQLATAVEQIPGEQYAQVKSLEAFAKCPDDSLQATRAFLRHALKCTTLFTGDGFSRHQDGTQGIEELLIRRRPLSTLNHRLIHLSP